jgi:periplasmic mercuric ion binding protein
MKNIILILLILTSGSILAQDKNAKATLEVDGVCMMCKMRIEKAAVKTKGVKTAVWNVESHQLSLIFDENKTNLKTIQENIAAVGHDNGEFIATEAAYNSVDPCCRYRDEGIKESHKNGEQH